MKDIEVEVKETKKEKSEKSGLSAKQIQEWKSKYGKIYKTLIGDDIFVWRKLKRKEYVRIMSSVDGDNDSERIYSRQEEIAKTAVIYPFDFDSVVENEAGIASTIADEILAKSGFDLTVTEEL